MLGDLILASLDFVSFQICTSLNHYYFLHLRFLFFLYNFLITFGELLFDASLFGFVITGVSALMIILSARDAFLKQFC